MGIPQFFPMGNSLLFYPKNPMGNSHHFFFLWEIPHFFLPTPLGNFSLFYLPPYGNSPLFYLPPYGNSPKKIWKKFFLRDIWTTVPPKMGVPPGERGHGGIPTPPLWAIWGGDCLSRLLIKIACQDCLFGYLFGCYLFSVLLISFILAVSDAILLFIFATFSLWRYLL